MASILQRGVLAASDEAAAAAYLSGNAFLQSLPPQVRAVEPEQTTQRMGGFSMQDLREFLMAYCAMFVAVSTFIF